MRRKTTLSYSSSRTMALMALTVFVLTVNAKTVWAQSENAWDNDEIIKQLQLQIVEIQRESQRKLEDLRRQTEQQLSQLQVQIVQLATKAESQGSVQGQHFAESGNRATNSVRDRLDLSGDFRLRYETNSSDGDTSSWDRGVLRARLAASYKLTDELKIGTRLVTGDSNNPRTADVTIGSFTRDLELSLDQAYASLNHGNLYLVGGKFPKPFKSTELVWDGDVNPQGVGVCYDLFHNETWSARLSGIYSTLNPSILEESSDMTGGQMSLNLHPSQDWTLGMHAAYFNYDIGALDPTFPGGARGNRTTPDGRYYLSDFNILDTVGTIAYGGFGDRWNIRFVSDYVKNLGAEGRDDSGYGFDLWVGNLKQPGRFLFRYGYSVVETDAVLGMYSNDNITFATNYELHTFSVDYAIQEHTYVGLTSYLYRHLDEDVNAEFIANDWLSRTRLNLYVTWY